MLSLTRTCIVILSFQAIQGSQEAENPDNPFVVESFEKNIELDGNSVVRTERSASNISCPGSTTSQHESITEDRKEIKCNCLPVQFMTILWLDINCQPVLNNDQLQAVNQTLTINFSTKNNNFSSWLFYCTNNLNCTSKITVIEEVKVGMPRALQGLVMFLVIVSLLGIFIFLFKYYRYQIYLGCRDCCTSSPDRDGLEFDAYVSVGKSISDIKFVEKYIADVLQLKHNYKLFVDDDNLLPRLEYSENVQTKMHQCRRLIIVFTPAYMTNEWCMYCFSEGLRKLLDLRIEMIFIVTDVSIQRDLSALSSLIGHVPKLFLSTLPMMQSKADKQRAMHKLRLLMPPSPRGPVEIGMKAPMLGNAEDIDQRSVNGNDTYGGTKVYTFSDSNPTNHKEEAGTGNFDTTQQELEYDDEDPASIRVNQYKPRLDFLRITVEDEDYT